MTRLDASRRRLLAARDARQAALERHLAASRGTIVAVSLGIPGVDKAPAGSAVLFAWAVGCLGRALPGARELHAGVDALGPFALWAAPGEAASVKEQCLTIEGARPAARLVDLDVYVGGTFPGARPLDRASLGRPPRACLCCSEPARECIRLSRHPFPDLVTRAHELLAHSGL